MRKMLIHDDDFFPEEEYSDEFFPNSVHDRFGSLEEPARPVLTVFVLVCVLSA